MAQNTLSVYYQNCGGIKSKIDKLKNSILLSNFDVIVLVETWLVDSVFDGELHSGGYDVFRRDRNLQFSRKKGGGGVLVMVKKGIKSIRLTEFEAPDLEEIYIHLPSHAGLLLTACYFSPVTHTSAYLKFFQKLHDIHASARFSNYIITGDFNLPYLIWSSSPDTLLQSANTESSKLLLHTMSFMNLKQNNVIHNNNGRLLDLVLTTLPGRVDFSDDPLLGPVPHHPPLDILSTVNRLTVMTSATFNQRNFFNADYDLINNAIDKVDWVTLLATSHSEDAVTVFYSKINAIIAACVPFSKPKSRKYPVWFSRGLIRALNRKKKLWCRWKTYKGLLDYQEFSLLRGRVKNLMKLCYNRYIERIEQSLKSNIKHFWKYTSTLKQSNLGYPKLMKYGSISSDDPKQIVELFSNYFQSVFEPQTHSDGDAVTVEESLSSDSQILVHNLYFDVDEISKELYLLDPSKDYIQ
ncbi:uncharacterized protein LOC123714671 [Pieris brassicae]|uniref:uncharacterized protein LOC123714671 n=1 Tax=Pieris brassicae TaxID=7116 RepID=UPI001E65EA30|nr:uncharacterized protein LOC123714671 [Pieris brassicae]